MEPMPERSDFDVPHALTRRGFLKTAWLTFGATCLLGLPEATVDAGGPPVIWHGSRELPLVAITVDDCYSLRALGALEGVLDRFPDARLTFFPTGRALLNTSVRASGLWHRLAANGHELGYHGFEHELPSLSSASELTGDFDRWLAACADAIQEQPQVRFARPPYGDISRSFEDMCSERDLSIAMWSTDWAGAWDDARRRVAAVQPGDIVLVHTRDQDIENLEMALSVLAGQPLGFVTLSTLAADCVGAKDAACRIPLIPKGRLPKDG
jgi:peptidoglycan/xylan/chitin deacetylase (PgdA/CDA1 family)